MKNKTLMIKLAKIKKQWYSTLEEHTKMWPYEPDINKSANRIGDLELRWPSDAIELLILNHLYAL